MLSFRTLAPALVLALPLTLLGAQAHADGAQPGPAAAVAQPAVQDLRTVRETCPGVDQALQRLLARTWFLEQKAGVLRVDFELNGGRPTNIRAHGALRRTYDQPIRLAVRQLVCKDTSEPAARYSFLISFSEDGSAANPQQWMALLEEEH